jgi:hypothetical protein
MSTKSSTTTSSRNQALEPVAVLIGKWKTVGTHPYLPGKTLHGEASFDWLEEGAFVVMRTRMDEASIPTGVAIFGSDADKKEFYMLYFDERGVSRKYDVAVSGNTIKWWRDAPNFSQRYTWTIEDGGRVIKGQGELSRDGSTWEDDLRLTYTRI